MGYEKVKCIDNFRKDFSKCNLTVGKSYIVYNHIKQLNLVEVVNDNGYLEKFNIERFEKLW